MRERFKKWMKRIIKTCAEVAVGAIGAQALITEVNWIVVGSTVALSAVVTALINIGDLIGE